MHLSYLALSTTIASLSGTQVRNSKQLITLFDTMSSDEASARTKFVNATATGEIPSFQGDEQARATDFANYFCSYAQLYHQKQMLADHNRMAAYHSAILGNTDVFKDKVVMDVGTGSGILAVWAAQAGAKKVYASKSRASVFQRFTFMCHVLTKFCSFYAEYCSRVH